MNTRGNASTIDSVKNARRNGASRTRRGFLSPFATRWYALPSEVSIETWNTDWESAKSTPPQKSAIGMRQ
jgi:hypothetical protein